ncbi:kinesin-domain-containing protein, partial [Martensiomyces pterosporus]
MPHSLSTQGLPRTFSFDYAFGPESEQHTVYDTAIAPLLARFVEGYNVTVLAYGQTSSGKTYTMGTDAEDASLLVRDDSSASAGIIPRALSWLFQWAQTQQPGGEEGESGNASSGDENVHRSSSANGGIDIRISFLEVYNEELIDLIALRQSRGVRPPIFIREDAKGNILWTGVKEVPASDAQDAMSILIEGSRERQTGGTRMNEKSSRSHAIYTIALTQTRLRRRSNSAESSGSVREPVKIVSKLHFVDLAGSERLKKTLAVGERQREGISINSGLLALGNVISALGDTQRGPFSYVPYRDSKLTHMLRDSLGGNAQTLLIACVSAAEANLAETVNTLKYAARARNIKNRGGVN